ncbi:hypothetical protein MY4824_001962 [Beauveria thailandica]
MSVFLVEVLKEKAEKSHAIFAYFFWDIKADARKTPTCILRSLIWQILVQKNELFPVMQEEYEKHHRKRVYEGLFNDFSALWAIFRSLLQHPTMGEAFILIDALDECEKSTRGEILVSIRSLFESLPKNAIRKVKFLVTCRNDIGDIEYELNGLGTHLRLDSAAINDDLNTYISAKVDELEQRNTYDAQIKTAVSDALKTNADGTFLWVSIMVAELKRPKVRNADVLEILKKLPQTLDDTYASILRQIEDHQEEAGFILRCLVAARRPLTPNEMVTALTVWKTGTRGDLSIYNDMISICSSMVCLSSDDTPALNLCHKSVKDFLLKERPSTRPWYSTTADEANWCLFNICWTHLAADNLACDLFPIFEPPFSPRVLAYPHLVAEPLALERQRLFEGNPFLEYAYEHWGDHAAAISGDLRQHWREMASDLSSEPVLRDNLLFSAVKEGNDELLQILLEHGANIEVRNVDGETPLLRAVELGRKNTMRVLLDFNADVEAIGAMQLSPLMTAASLRSESRIRLLLEKNAKINAKNCIGYTAFTIAVSQAIAGHGRNPVKLLLDRGADTEVTTLWEMTPLHTASLEGRSIIGLLVERGANIEAKAELGMTPLCFAVAGGQIRATKFLLNRGAEVNVRTSEGQCPLHLAAQYVGEQVVHLRLDREAEADGSNTAERQDALRLAGQYDREQIVQLLLDHGAEIDCRDQDGWTPLCWAAFNGNTEIIRLLVEGGAEVNIKTLKGATPLRIARAEKQADAVQRESQILIAILDHLPLKALLKATLLCRAIHLLAVHTLQRRLLAVSSRPGRHEVMLECYHPSLKISTPYLSCRPLGARHPTTDCSATRREDEEEDEEAPPTSLGQVCQLYASFLPVVTEENRRRRNRNMAWPVSVRDGGPPGAAAAAAAAAADQVATQQLPFDDGALFSQLCVALNLVTPHGCQRHRGIFVSHYNMSEHVVRVFRRWLEESMAGDDGERTPSPWDPTAPTAPPPPPLASSRILWVDAARTIGLRFRVSPGPAERMPLLSGTDEEDPAVSYTLTCQELLIRSTSLLMAVEASANKEMEPSHNSIILSSAA